MVAYAQKSLGFEAENYCWGAVLTHVQFCAESTDWLSGVLSFTSIHELYGKLVNPILTEEFLKVSV